MVGNITHTVNIDEMQFRFCPGQGTMDAIFIIRQLQEKYLKKHWKLCMALFDLEKAFNKVPLKVLLGALHSVGELGARNTTRVSSSFSEEFEAKVGVHQESVLSPLLFIIVLEALLCKFHVGCPW